MNDIEKLITGCLNNDIRSQEKLYKLHYPAFYALCKRFFTNEHDILTAINNGMLKVYKNIKQFNAAKGSFFNWSYTTIRNEALTILRNKKVTFSYELNHIAEENASISPFRELEWKEVYYYLDQLPVVTRSVCALFYLEGFSIKEISVLLELKEGTVKWHLSECRSRLKLIFEQYNYQTGG